MILSHQLLAVAGSVALGFAAAGLTVQTTGSARANAGGADIGIAEKGNLEIDARCAGQSWPEIAPTCLTGADGGPARPVRTVTIGHQVGEATTVLIRLPRPQVATH